MKKRLWRWRDLLESKNNDHAARQKRESTRALSDLKKPLDLYTRGLQLWHEKVKEEEG
jgi:hypothetical protein